MEVEAKPPFPFLVDLNVISINLNTSLSVQAQGRYVMGDHHCQSSL